MQGLGSAITYARRYSLAAICGISQDDDDGEGSVGRTGRPKVAANDDSEWIANNPSVAHTTNVVNRHTVIPHIAFTPPDNAGAFVCQCGAPMILSREKTHYYCQDYKNELVSHTKSFKAVI